MEIQVQENRCSGCKLCQQICAITHYKEINPKKSALKIKAKFPAPGKFSPVVCFQCGDCAEACPFGAIEKVGGAYVVNKDNCTGCAECVSACAQGVMVLPGDEDAPLKCDGCGKCAEVCNTGALRGVIPICQREEEPCTVSAVRLSA